MAIKGNSIQKHTVFEYQYRDGANYKAWGEVLLVGEYSAYEEATIRDACDWNGTFVAEQVGIPALYKELYKFSGGPTLDDHAFHEFLGLRRALAKEVRKMTPRDDVHNLISRFCAASGSWDCRFSPHCDI